MSNWNTDAQFVNEINEDNLFKNSRIEGFLRKNSYDKFILVASKGMGKTLLIRHKRKAIEEEGQGIFIIPRNDTADYVNLPASLGNDLLTAMSKQVFWEDVWKLSISISALLNFPHHINDHEKKVVVEEIVRAELPSKLEKELLLAFDKKFISERKPSSVLDILLQSGRSTLENSRSTGLQIISELFNSYISSACFIFIDSFDQALAHNFSDNLGVWCAAQTGLMKASWELSRHNRHVKVFTTIRYEAYSSFTDTEKLNISGSVLLIEYSKEDLKGIFEIAISSYENCNSIEDFVGFRSMYNGYLRTQEDVFEYIYRHTIGVPRWLMKIGEELSNARNERGIDEDQKVRKKLQKRVAEIVNRVSAEDLAYEHLRSEMKMFFRGDEPQQFIEKFLSQLNSSILSLSNIQRISKKFVAENSWCEIKHPFCLLYNLGFIGYIAGNSIDKHKQQVFKRPYQFDWSLEGILPINPNTYYLIHPSLHYILQKKNHRFNFNMVRIGDGLAWRKKEDDQINKETLKIFISYSHTDGEKIELIVDIIDNYLNDRAQLHDIWFDRWKMKGGKWFQDQMLSGLKDSDYLILAVSRNSMESAAVQVEWKTKFGEKISKNIDTVFPFLIDDFSFKQLPEYLQQIYAYRYEDSRDNVIKLVEDILFWKSEKSHAKV